ncbi:MAG: hypothetical protein VKJ46_13230, partial [Leptolyngbyaceae bacterium]|nr:hypothetical protein [Leptolyngbyaceae bacterium]
DNNWVEQSWENYALPVLKGRLPLQWALQSWIKLANEKNGYDNTSIVLSHYRVTTAHQIQLVEPAQVPSRNLPLESELSEASKALLYSQAVEPESVSPLAPVPLSRRSQVLRVGLGVLVLACVSGVSLAVWSNLDPQGFKQMRDRLPDAITRFLPVP